MNNDDIRNIIIDWFEHNSHDTGWIACSDWTDQHLGDTVGGNVSHSLDANLSDLIIKVLISTDGTDDNSFEIVWTDHSNDDRGITIYQVDSDTITVQTGANAFYYLDGSGNATTPTNGWYYKIKIWKISGFS